MNNELAKSIQQTRDGIQGIMEFLPSYVKDNEYVRGVRYTFRTDGLVPDTLARVLDILDAIESIETIDKPGTPFLSKVELGKNYNDYLEAFKTNLFF